MVVVEHYGKGNLVDSDLGKKNTDSQGSPVCGARMDALEGYTEIPELLQRFINHDDQSAWATIVKKIDYIYDHVDYSLSSLDMETDFVSEIQSQIKSGKKLLFKPNLVGPQVIDQDTHGEDLGAPVCTDWSVIAALMRWFHDKLNIDYYQMALGEASTSSLLIGKVYSLKSGKTVTTEAVFEGRCGDFYGGWGFYFVRKYLKEHHPSSHTDDPMNGYEDSIKGRYLEPGKAQDRLMVYDLNKVGEDPSRGRTVPVPGGENFKNITLHKAVVGGDPQNTDDIKDYPGCVLINVPKMKIHAQDLITNAIKNLGIGLYPTECPSSSIKSSNSWEYAMPATENPTFKGKLPHMPWVAEIDEDTNLPIMDENGAYLVTKTGGMKATQADVIKAVQNQGVFMVHVSDCLHMINLNHNPEGIAVRIPEGYIWSSLDCVALDLLCARYCFKTVPMSEGIKLKEENNWNTEFVRHVPVAKIDGKNIKTEEGLDSPLFRYNLYEYAEKRGIGQQKYFVTGWDSVTSTPLTSMAGHLGRIENEKFVELMTKTMYYNPSCMLWDMQKTILSYAEANDQLTGTSIFKEFMDGFDENHDGIIDYDENGRKGIWTPGFSIMSYALHMMITEDFGAIKGPFYQNANFYLKNGNAKWNPQGHDFAQEYVQVGIATMAYEMSKSETQSEDPFVSGMKWGNGLWPSWELAKHTMLSSSIYGASTPDKITINSLYGLAFSYADKTGNEGLYTGSVDQGESDPEALNAYFNAVSKGADLLDFILYVPQGWGSLGNAKIPNVEETSDPDKIFTAHFNQGQEVW
ncbi:MAG: DUF362 domain-containing protein [Methanobacteriaceae archaeon]|nr:DUF362 domain-containing protein [Methanobacteriaceae archaeon]